MKLVFTIAFAGLLLISESYCTASDVLIRIDIQAPVNNNGVLTTDEPTATAQSSNFGNDGTNYWNPVEKPPTSAPLPTHLLKASDAPAGPVVGLFDITGVGYTSLGYQVSSDPLRHDYVQAVSTSPVAWQVSGLAPNSSYELMLYGGQDSFGNPGIVETRFTLDLDGDTVLETTADIMFSQVAVYFPSMFTDSSGVLRGTFAQVAGNAPGSGTWPGLQIYGPMGIPEPTCAVLGCLAMVSGVVPRRRRY